MPLPPALLAKLAKRGILNNTENKEKTEIIKRRPVEEEEVIAESYDDKNEPKENSQPKNETSNKKFQPYPVMEKRRLRMLKIYPLPPNWVEVPDLNTDRYYYWNTETDQICWLSPSHPKAKIEFAKKSKQNEVEKPPVKETKRVDFSKMDDKETRHDDKYKPYKKKQKGDKDEIDPMDPASYSDIPRGKWSAGLDG
ncbi:unnamed protein product [Brachionus calyciflorus]|uniref:WW domain-containing protein n=1 Tax=Brachionus calyciflorus TaxID=104777 RepID=A0A813T6J2_9BILA|nr:unnamed protein product [Brachionus calyciflorus]